MNYVISIVNPKEMKKLVEISRKLEITMGVVFLGHGTAVQSMLDLLGIESNEKRVAVMIVSPEKTRELIREEKRQMFIGVPGHGIVVSVPIKSIGGGKTGLHRPGEGSHHDSGQSGAEGGDHAGDSPEGRTGFGGGNHRVLPAGQRSGGLWHV